MVSTIPLLMISSASSLELHWLIGRPESSGSSQAMASIWQRWSAVIRLGAPGRGRSSSRSSTLKSSSEMGLKVSQRLRHNFDAALSTPNSRAISELFLPSAAAKTIRARRAICWRVLWRRTNLSRPWRSSSVSLISDGFGPGTLFTSSCIELAYFTPFCSRRQTATLFTRKCNRSRAVATSSYLAGRDGGQVSHTGIPLRHPGQLPPRDCWRSTSCSVQPAGEQTTR